MATKRRSRRVDQMEEEFRAEVRRSPRLRDRYSVARVAGGYPLGTVTRAATSRPSLGGYNRQRGWDQQGESILNESGQSVPSTFDLEDDASSTSSGAGEYRFTSTAQHYSAPRQITDLQHLHGLDGSEQEEEEEEDGGSECYKEYHVVEKTRVTVTPPSLDRHYSTGAAGRPRSFLVQAVVDLLFKFGSLLYLAATAILCLDVIILHRLTGWRDQSTSTPWLRFLILPLVLCTLVAVLIGGGMVPDPRQPQFNITRADLEQLKSDVTSSIRATLSSDISQHIDQHWEEVVKVWVDQQVKHEAMSAQEARETLRSTVLLKISSLQKELAVLVDQRLTELWSKVNSSAVNKTAMVEAVTSHIKLHLDSAKEEWLKLVRLGIKEDIAGVSESVDKLKEQLQEKDNYYTKQFSSLDKRIEEYNSTVANKLALLISELEKLMSKTALLQGVTDGHTQQLTSLEAEVSAVVVSLMELKKETQRRIKELEEMVGRAVGEEEVVRIFGEELSKQVESRDGLLWSWLATELKRVLQEGDFSPHELSKKDVGEMIQLALLRYSADRIAKFDFALENSGGSVVEKKCSTTYPPALSTYTVMGIPVWSIPSSPKAIIQTHVNPGDCWALNGTTGYALIRLKQPIVITTVTLEHIPKELTPTASLSSAPKDFRVVGKNDCDDDDEGDTVAELTYSTDGPPIQEFEVKQVKKVYDYVRFEFLSNHGNEDYTCIYRVRVHGYLETS